MSGAYNQTMSGNADAESQPAKPARRKMLRVEMIPVYVAIALVLLPMVIRERILSGGISNDQYLLLLIGWAVAVYALSRVWDRRWQAKRLG